MPPAAWGPPGRPRLWGVDDGALGNGDVDEGLDGVVLVGRLCGGGGRSREGGSGCGGWGVLVWVGVRVRAMCLGLSSLLLWCWGLRGEVLVMVLLLLVLSFGARVGFGVRFRVGVRFEVGEDIVFEVRGHWCRVRGGSWYAAGVTGLPVCGSEGLRWPGVRPQPLLLSVALLMSSAGRGGSEDEVGDVDEDEDKEVVVSDEAGCAVMRAVAGLLAAASAAATAGRMQGISTGCRLAVGGSGGLAVSRRPGGPIWLAALGEEGAGLRFLPSALGLTGVLQCVRLCGLASAGGNSLRGLHSGAGGGGLGFPGCVRGACTGHWAGRACREAPGSMRRVCAGRRVWGVVRRVQRCVRGGRLQSVPLSRGPGVRALLGVCLGCRPGTGGGEAGAGIARGAVLCLCMCLLAAVRLSGQL